MQGCYSYLELSNKVILFLSFAQSGIQLKTVWLKLFPSKTIWQLSLNSKKANEHYRMYSYSQDLKTQFEKQITEENVRKDPDYVRLLRLFKAIPYHQQTEKNFLEALSEYIIESASVSDLLLRLP